MITSTDYEFKSLEKTEELFLVLLPTENVNGRGGAKEVQLHEGQREYKG